MVSPAALSIILTNFAEGPERNRALAVWGAIAGAGGAIGLLLGGVIVEALSWRWVFFVNVPIGAAVLALAPRIVPESRSERSRRRIRRRGRRHDHARHDRARLHADQGRQLGLDFGADAGGLRHRGRADRRVHPDRAAPRRSPGPAADLLQPQPRRRRRDVPPGGGGALRGVLLLHALSPAGAGLQRPQDRGRLPAAEPDPHRCLGARLPPRRPLHPQAGPHRPACSSRQGVSFFSPELLVTATTRATSCRR